MSQPLAIPLALVGSIVVAAALTGCSSGGLPGTPASAGSANNSSTAPTAQPSPSTAAGVLPTECPTASDIQAALGASVPDPQQESTSTLLSCIYTASSDLSLVVLYEPVPAGATIDQMKAEVKKKTGGTLGPLSGIGDGGFTTTDGSNNYVYVLSHGIQLAIGGPHSLESLEGAASKLLAN